MHMDEFAHIWPRGGSFAFSGIDGTTRFEEPFIPRGTEGGIGWTLNLRPPITFEAQVGRVRLLSEGHPEDICFADCWRFFAKAGANQGSVEGAFLDRATLVVRIFADGVPDNTYPELVPSAAGHKAGSIELFEGAGCWVALSTSPAALHRQFAIAISYGGPDDAIHRAEAGCAVDVGELVEARIGAYRTLQISETLGGTNRRAFFKAASLQKVYTQSPENGLQGHWTAPASRQATHMWLWDTAFHSLGLQHVRMDLAEEVIRSLLAKQAADGQLPFPFSHALPTPEAEEAQPPILAWTVWRQFESGLRTAFLEEVYPRLTTYVEWFERNRKNDNGLYGWRLGELSQGTRFDRGVESGMPNSPRFDGITSITAVDLCSYMATEFFCLERMAKTLEKESDAARWHERRTSLASKINELLWDDADRFYYDLDEYGEFIPVKTTAGLLPLYSRIPDRDQAESLRGHMMNPMEFNTPMPLPSVSIDEKSFSAKAWRGAVWPDINLLLYYGLMSYGFFHEAREIAHRTLDEIARCYVLYGCLYECYDPMKERAPFDMPRLSRVAPERAAETGSAADFLRTATSFVHLAHEVS